MVFGNDPTALFKLSNLIAAIISADVGGSKSIDEAIRLRKKF